MDGSHSFTCELHVTIYVQCLYRRLNTVPPALDQVGCPPVMNGEMSVAFKYPIIEQDVPSMASMLCYAEFHYPRLKSINKFIMSTYYTMSLTAC